MSKSLGNVISPAQMVEKFGVDGTRYLLLTLGSFGEDADVTLERLAEKYNADLANGLGNLVSRVIKLAQDYTSSGGLQAGVEKYSSRLASLARTIKSYFDELKLKEILDEIWEQVAWANKYIEEEKLWELVKTDKPKAEKVLAELLGAIIKIGESLAPFMPETSKKILAVARAENIKKGEALFPRII